MARPRQPRRTPRRRRITLKGSGATRGGCRPAERTPGRRQTAPPRRRVAANSDGSGERGCFQAIGGRSVAGGEGAVSLGETTRRFGGATRRRAEGRRDLRKRLDGLGRKTGDRSGGKTMPAMELGAEAELTRMRGGWDSGGSSAKRSGRRGALERGGAEGGGSTTARLSRREGGGVKSNGSACMVGW